MNGCLGGWSALRCASKGMMRLCERTERETNVWRDLFRATFPRMQGLLHRMFSFRKCTEDWQRWRTQYISCIGELCSITAYLYLPNEGSTECSNVWLSAVSSGKKGRAARVWSVRETLEQTVSRATAFSESSHGNYVQTVALHVYVPRIGRDGEYNTFLGAFPMNNLLLSKRKNGVVFSASVGVSPTESVACPFVAHLQVRMREEVPENECSCKEEGSDGSTSFGDLSSSDDGGGGSDGPHAERLCRTFGVTCGVRLQTSELTERFLQTYHTETQNRYFPFTMLLYP